MLTLALALSLAPSALAQGQTCRIESEQYGTIEYPCGSGESSGSGSPDEDWWETGTFQAVLGVIGILGSAGAAGYTYYRVRSRRRALTVTLAAIERAYADAKADPEAGVATLAQLRTQVREQHGRGRLDDAHFLELDKRATQYLVKLRLFEIDRRFATLPPLLLAEIRRLLSDGMLTPAEADLVEVRAAAYRIPEGARAQLAELTRRWASEDAPPAEASAMVT